jgi:predicted ATPase
LLVHHQQEWADGTVTTRYGFQHALYQSVLYEQTPLLRRISLHRKLALRLERGYGERSRAIAAELAMHFSQGRIVDRAVHYQQQAAETALRRCAYHETIAHLQRALTLVPSLPDTPARAQQELTLQVTLGAALVATTGYASSETEQAYARARSLCQQAGETPHLLPVLWGMWVVYFVRGELTAVTDLCAQLLRIACTTDDPGLLTEAHMDGLRILEKIP